MSATLSRTEYNKLPPLAKATFHKTGGKIVHTGANTTAAAVIAKQLMDDKGRTGRIVTRQEFDAMSSQEKSAFFEDGGRIGGPHTIREIAKAFGLSSAVADVAISASMSPENFRGWAVAHTLKSSG